MGKYSKKREGTKSRQFTNVEKLKDNFLANSERRRKAKDKEHGDAGYWTNGKCNWGGEHYLDRDCETLAEFFNATASIADDVEQIKLSANEQIFNQKKQTLVSKIRDCINKCQVSDVWSIAYVCCIWNDYFGDFFKPYLNTFSAKLQRQLSEVEKLEPKHQKELLKLEAEAKQAENEYKENKAKADQETDPDKKAQFMYLANKAVKKVEEIKRRVKANPLADLSRFSNLDDLEILIGGNVPKNPPKPKTNPTRTSSGGGSGGTIPNPLEDPQSFFQQNQTLIFITLALVAILFLLYSQNQKEEDEDSKEEKKLMRQMMLMRMMNNKVPKLNPDE